MVDWSLVMSFGQRFIYNLSLGILTGAISTDLDDAISDDLIYMSLTKSSSDNKSIGKKEWLRSIRNNNRNHTPRFCLEVARVKKLPLFKTFLVKNNFKLPYPLMNIINGGAHANNGLRIQEFMIRPDRAKNFSDAMRICYVVIKNLSKIIKNRGLSTSVGDEGGFAPMISSNNLALDLIVSAIKKSGFVNGRDVSICLDVAANELYKKGKYSIHSKSFISVEKSIKEFNKIITKYKIKSIEDPFAENDWISWNKLMKNTSKVQIVGDDLYVTNLERLKKGFLNISSNAILIKLNQIGTVSETLEVIKFAQIIGFKTIISHRSGDSEDTFIADLAVGTNSDQIKTGSLARSERVAKYNQLLRIEEGLGKKARMNKIH